MSGLDRVSGRRGSSYQAAAVPVPVSCHTDHPGHLLNIHQSDRYTFSMYIIKTGMSPCKIGTSPFASIRQVRLRIHQSDRYSSICINQTGTSPFATIRQVHCHIRQSDRYISIHINQTGTPPYQKNITKRF